MRKSLDTRRFEEISSGSASLLDDKEKRFKSRIDEAAVKIPDTAAKEKERYQWIEDFYSQKLFNRKRQRIMDSISESSCILSSEEEEEGNAVIVASTLTGRTARMISRFRPNIKAIIGVVHDTGFTSLFEADVVALCKEMPVASVAARVKIHEESAWRILAYHVNEAIVRVDLSPLDTIGVDEISI